MTDQQTNRPTKAYVVLSVDELIKGLQTARSSEGHTCVILRAEISDAEFDSHGQVQVTNGKWERVADEQDFREARDFAAAREVKQ